MHDQLVANFKSERHSTASILVSLKAGIYPHSTFWRLAWLTRDKNEIFLPWIFVNTPCDTQTCTCMQSQSQFISIPYINLFDSSPMRKYPTKKQMQRLVVTLKWNNTRLSQDIDQKACRSLHFQRKSVSISIKISGLGNLQCLNDVYSFAVTFLFSDTTHVAFFLHVADDCCSAEEPNGKSSDTVYSILLLLCAFEKCILKLFYFALKVVRKENAHNLRSSNRLTSWASFLWTAFIWRAVWWPQTHWQRAKVKEVLSPPYPLVLISAVHPCMT